MSDRDTATRLVRDEIARWNAEDPLPDDDEVVLREEHTEEHPFGWVFFFNSRRYVETRDLSYALGGNGPLIVDRRDGSIHQMSPAYALEDSIRAYAQGRGPEVGVCRISGPEP